MTERGLATHATTRPDKVALVHRDRRITYGELDELVTRATHVLAACGVGPDRRLGIALGNRPEWLVAALGAARLGAEVVPVPPGATDDERDYFCTDGKVGFLLDERGLDEFRAALDGASTQPRAEVGLDYVVTRAYTSGTTGRPKAVARPTVDVAANIEGLVRYYTAYGLDSFDEVNITGSPIHHIAGFSGPHSALLLGHTSVILDHFDAVEWFEAVAREGVTYAWCAPVHLYRLMSAPAEVRDRADVSAIKRLLHGSAPCAPSLKQQVIEFFPDNAVWETYGGTETMGTVITGGEWLAKPGSVGPAAPGSTIKIFDDDGVELPPGQVGLIYIGSDWGRGFRYDGDPELTESVYIGNLATLGDLGYLDEDGYLFVVDRRKDMVITGGANVYPAEVEAVLVTHPGIEEVAVVGLPDAEYGEVVTAVVVPTADAFATLDAETVIAYSRERLVRYKAPRRVEFVTVLPRDPMGKIRKRELRASYT